MNTDGSCSNESGSNVQRRIPGRVLVLDAAEPAHLRAVLQAGRTSDLPLVGCILGRTSSGLRDSGTEIRRDRTFLERAFGVWPFVWYGIPVFGGVFVQRQGSCGALGAKVSQKARSFFRSQPYPDISIGRVIHQWHPDWSLYCLLTKS